MPSLLKSSTANTALLRSLLSLLLLLVAFDSAQGASLREPRLRGSEPDPDRADASYLTPNADMLKALEYIESLSTRTGVTPQQRTLLPPGQNGNDTNDEERAGTRLRMASLAQSQSQTGGGEEEEDEEGEGERNEEDKTQEWLQTILSTLQGNQKPPKSAPVHPRAVHSSLGRGGPPAMEEQEEEAEDDSAYQWPQRSTVAGSRPHNKHPLQFEDDEGGDWEEEESEGQALSHDSPFKRTNENVEEKYTPQNLATLQSLFEELGRLTNGKAGHKRQAEEDDDDEGMRPVYEDVAGIRDWLPQEEEEERSNNGQYNTGLEDDEEDEDDGGEEEDEGNYQVKRSNQPSLADDPDDITKLMDYYLLKVLEKTEEQEQKRELEEEEVEEEEEERAERRVSESQYSGITTPEAVYQLIEISKKLQIPPEDLLDMLKKEDRTPLRSQARSMMASEKGRVQDKLTQMPSLRRLPETHRPKINDVNTEEILNILGLISDGGQTASPLKKHTHYKTSHSRFDTPSERQQGYTLPQTRLPDKFKDYDDTVDEDVLAAYLAAQLLAQYPLNNKVKPRRSSQSPSHDQEEQSNFGTFEQAMQDYFDQMDTDKIASQKRQSETGDMGGAPQMQTLDDDAMLKILSYLNPETEDTEDKDPPNKIE
ncbi:secretogranin-2a [Aplochiton taeniatus]